MGGDFRQLGGDFLAKALEPEGPPPAQETLLASELPAKSRGSPVPSPSSQLKGSLKFAMLLWSDSIVGKAMS